MFLSPEVRVGGGGGFDVHLFWRTSEFGSVSVDAPPTLQAVALMRQHHGFLLSVDAKGEAKALGEHLAPRPPMGGEGGGERTRY